MTEWKFDFSKEKDSTPAELLDWLFLSHEENIDDVLYGKVLEPMDFYGSSYYSDPKVNYWIRISCSSICNQRKLLIPGNVRFVHFTMNPEKVEMNKEIFIQIKMLLELIKDSDKKVVLSYQRGNESAIIPAFWSMSEILGSKYAWKLLNELNNQTCFNPEYSEFVKNNIHSL